MLLWLGRPETSVIAVIWAVVVGYAVLGLLARVHRR